MVESISTTAAPKGITMKAAPIRKSLTALKAVGPYLLVELLLPGGTLVAFILWLSQRFTRGGRIGGMHRYFSREKSQRPAIEAKPHPVAYASPLDPLGAAGR